MILLEPRQDARGVIMVLTGEKEDFIAPPILLSANGAHVLLPYFVNRPSVQSLNEIAFDPMYLHLIEHFFIIYSFKCFCSHARNRRFVSVGISVHDCLPLVIPVNEVQVVLASGITPDRRILSDVLLFRRIGALVLPDSRFYFTFFASTSCRFLLVFFRNGVECFDKYIFSCRVFSLLSCSLKRLIVFALGADQDSSSVYRAIPLCLCYSFSLSCCSGRTSPLLLFPLLSFIFLIILNFSGLSSLAIRKEVGGSCAPDTHLITTIPFPLL